MIHDLARRLRTNIQKVIVGKDAVIDLRAGGRAVRRAHPDGRRAGHRQDDAGARPGRRRLGCTFQRIQFTPDLLPSDVTGINWFNQKTQAFEFRPGPAHGPGGAGRRDQPRHAAHAVRAAGGDAGAPGDGGRRHPPAAAPLPGAGHAEPGRAGGHLPAARGAARPLPAAPDHRLPVGAGGSGDPASASALATRSSACRP